ncbi:hypothetical protein PG996_010525 [Apiospora saccharicola]|uniref:Uncharacterized protein n=1 Tax=Apiospora saccharicola TaxID=335842 RepID=A0ABR1UNU2_9PEZI
MATINFPAGWSSQRLNTISVEEFSQVPEQERAALKQVVRRHAFTPEYKTLQKLNQELSSLTARTVTPPSYVPAGWTVEQAKGVDITLVTKLSEEEKRLWAAGKCADAARQARKTGQPAIDLPAYIPAGWSVEQAVSPTFDILSQLSQEDLTKYMEARNAQVTAQTLSIPAATTSGPLLSSSSSTSNAPMQPPSPLIQTLQRKEYPAWGFVIVRTYYASEERWQAFQEKLDALCDAQLDEESGLGLQRVKDTLEFKMIEDPRLQGVDSAEARRHFHIARAMGGVAAGLDLELFLLVDEGVVASVLDDGGASPYLVAVDVAEPVANEMPAGYPGLFRVAGDVLLSELYPKLGMGLSPRELWATLADGQDLWTGDDE